MIEFLPTNPTNRKAWTKPEIKSLLEFIEQGISVADIAKRLSRSLVSVESKLWRMDHVQSEQRNKENISDEIK